MFAQIFKALQASNELRNPEAWKKVQLILLILIAVQQILKAFNIEVSLTENELTTIASAISLVVTTYLTVATTKKIGFKPKQPKVISNDHPDQNSEAPQNLSSTQSNVTVELQDNRVQSETLHESKGVEGNSGERAENPFINKEYR